MGKGAFSLSHEPFLLSVYLFVFWCLPPFVSLRQFLFANHCFLFYRQIIYLNKGIEILMQEKEQTGTSGFPRKWLPE